MGATFQRHFAYSKSKIIMDDKSWQQQEKQELSNDNCDNQSASFYIHMEGDIMSDAGINDNDLLIASPKLPPEDGSIVIAMINGQLAIRRYFNVNDRIYLVPENVNYPSIEISDDRKYKICGVVTKIIPSWQAKALASF